MERRHVSLLDDLLSSGADDDIMRQDSTIQTEGINLGAPSANTNSTGGNPQPSYDASVNTSKGGRRISASAQVQNPSYQGQNAQPQQQRDRDHGNNASVALVSTSHRRRSLRRRGSFVTASRHGGKHNVCTVHLEGDTGGIEVQAASEHLLAAVRMREKYKSVDKGQSEGSERLVPPVVLSFESGVIQFNDQRTQIVPWEQFYDDVMVLHEVMQHPHCHRACSQRLHVLEEKYNLYKLCNETEESVDRNRRCGGVFADCTKVDNCVYLSNIMNAQWLFEYIQDTIEEQGEDVVRLSSDKKEPQTLQRACEVLDFADPSQLSVDGLGLLPPTEKRLYRYDVLDPEINRAGRSSAELLRLFLTRDTLNKGQYFAEAVRPILQQNDARNRCTQATESVVEIAGGAADEWERLAHWVHDHTLAEHRNNQWIIALPRRQIRRDIVNDSFEHHQQHLEHLFLPLFMATLAPEDPKNTQLASLLNRVGGFLIVSDEEERESDFKRKPRRPAEVPWSENVCDLYFAYYVWANISSLNAFRRRKGLNTFQLRAFAGGRSSQVDVLVYSYLLCDGLANGVVIAQQPVLQYLYGLQRIGMMMSPLSNNGLGMPYTQNPFPLFFRRGLNVALSTDQPLLFHHSREAIIEEYGTASKLYQLSGIDVCEIALNSVLMSSFSLDVKGIWLGESFFQEGIKGNVFELSRVPTPRLELRQDMWQTELYIILEASRKRVRGDPGSGGGAPATSNSNTAAAVTAAAAAAAIATAVPGSSAAAITPAAAAAGTQTNSNSVTVERAGSVATTTAGATSAATCALAGSSISGAGGTFNAWGLGGSSVDCGTSLNAIGPAVTMVPSSKMPHVVIDPHVDFPRVVFVGPSERDSSHAAVAQLLHRALELRAQYVRLRRIEDIGTGKEFLHRHEIEDAFRRNDTFDEDEWMFKTVEGVLVPHEVHQIPRLPKDMFHYDDFRVHVQELRSTVENIHVRNFAARRLNLLDHKFMLHLAVNRSLEAGSTAKKASQNRDFYQATKVDNNVRMEMGMTARQLLNFIVSKSYNSGDDIVSHQEGKEPQTLRQLLQELHISPDTLTVDDLNVQVDATLGVASSDQYTPVGRDKLLTLLLKTDNQMKGRYFAELTKLTFDNFKHDRFTFTENRLPVYGASDMEWSLLSDWFDTHGMASSHNQWMVQVPRIYSYLRKTGKVHNFAEYLENIFKPLWAVSLHPSKDPRLFHFVNHISGFDSVEDEQRPDTPLHIASKAPHEWTGEEEPPYNYYMYHMWANIYSLNEFRRRRNFSIFTFRPSCGETGPVEHLIGGFLLSNAINYGITLATDPPLQYLFYLAQIGVTVSPLSNNTKVLSYLDNPFPRFFCRGLKVSLGTDSPLMFHHTLEPLLEEYSIASKVWKLGPNDMCEIARNSVLLCGFDAYFKRERLGDLFFLSSSKSNDAMRTHLSDIRVAYRYDTYHTEVAQLEYIAGLEFPKSLLTLSEESAREAEFHEAVKKKDAPKMGIIDSNPDEADLDKLQQHRTLMQRQLEELGRTLNDLQRQNRQLTEKLADERTRDQQAQQLRRRGVEERWEQLLSAPQEHTTEAASGQLNASRLFSLSGNQLANTTLASSSTHPLHGSGNNTTNPSLLAANTAEADGKRISRASAEEAASRPSPAAWLEQSKSLTGAHLPPPADSSRSPASNASNTHPAPAQPHSTNSNMNSPPSAGCPSVTRSVSGGAGLVTFWENMWSGAGETTQPATLPPITHTPISALMSTSTLRGDARTRITPQSFSGIQSMPPPPPRER